MVGAGHAQERGRALSAEEPQPRFSSHPQTGAPITVPRLRNWGS
jgi:hypothetical protein